jgi:hypothetical protein
MKSIFSILNFICGTDTRHSNLHLLIWNGFSGARVKRDSVKNLCGAEEEKAGI